MFYPWQNEQWQQLLQAKQEGRLPHALLFVGIRGIGKAYFAECFIRAQLCKNESNINCDCHSCRLIAGRTHPNVLWIEPEKPGSPIKIDPIREVTEFINQTSMQGEYRFVVINPANRMNLNAANALLKTLEEPASGSILILIAEQVSQLPATILSRCQHIYFHRPEKNLAQQFLSEKSGKTSVETELVLNIAHGAPLAALELMNNDILDARLNLLQGLYALRQPKADPVQLSESIEDMNIGYLLDFTFAFVMDILRLYLEGDSHEIMNQDFIPQLTEIKQKISLADITKYLDYLLLLGSQHQKGINHNKQLLIESLLIRWMEMPHVSC